MDKLKVIGKYEVKLRDLNESLNLINEAVIYCIALVDNKRPPADEILFLSDFLRRNFGHITAEQIKKAFDYSIAGKIIDAKTGKRIDLQLYGANFSVAYISNVINAYLDFEEHERKSKKQVVVPNENKLSRGEMDLIIAENIIILFERYKITGVLMGGLSTIYDYLWRKEIYRLDEGTRNMLRMEAMENIIADKKKEADNNRIQKLAVNDFIKSIEENADHDAIICEGKRLAVKYYFDELIEKQNFK